MQIRRPTNADQEPIEHLRQERLDLLQQVNPNIAGTSMNLSQIFADPNAQIWVALQQDQLIGYILMWQDDSPYGTLDEHHIIIDELVLDLHHYHQHAADELLNTILQHHENANAVYIRVPRFLAVEQAFWRAKKAKSVDATVHLTRSRAYEWMKL